MLNPIDVIITRYQINDETKNKINARSIIKLYVIISEMYYKKKGH